MANMKKFRDFKDIGHLLAHYERSVEKGHYGNEDIDQDKLHLDHENLAPTRFKMMKDSDGLSVPKLDDNGNPIQIKQTEYLKEKIEEVMGDRTLRKDAVKMCCWVIDAPKTLPVEKRANFFREAYNFLIDRYGKKSGMGEDVCISCYIHKSESTEHIHFAFMPVMERDGIKSFCAKECVGREDLKTFHEDLSRWMSDRNICTRSDILTGSTIRDSSGRALSVKELKLKDYYERKRDNQNRFDIKRNDTPTRGRF